MCEGGAAADALEFGEGGEVAALDLASGLARAGPVALDAAGADCLPRVVAVSGRERVQGLDQVLSVGGALPVGPLGAGEAPGADCVTDELLM